MACDPKTPNLHGWPVTEDVAWPEKMIGVYHTGEWDTEIGSLGIHIIFQMAQTFDFPLMKTHTYLSFQRITIVDNFKVNVLRFVR